MIEMIITLAEKRTALTKLNYILISLNYPVFYCQKKTKIGMDGNEKEFQNNYL
jgi:hypothetical protein